jgi:BON domain-containing protein
MKLSFQRAAVHFERPGRYGSLEIIAPLAGANSARASLSRLQALDQIASDAIRCVLVLLITALSILVARLPHDAPVTQTWGAAARIEARIHVPRETPLFMYAGVRGWAATFKQRWVIQGRNAMNDKQPNQTIGFRSQLALRERDDEIAKRALSLLRWKIRYNAIRVNAEKGHVTLSGEVSWDLDRETAEHAVRKLSGVVGITNLITIKPYAIFDESCAPLWSQSF